MRGFDPKMRGLEIMLCHFTVTFIGAFVGIFFSPFVRYSLDKICEKMNRPINESFY